MGLLTAGERIGPVSKKEPHDDLTVSRPWPVGTGPGQLLIKIQPRTYLMMKGVYLAGARSGQFPIRSNGCAPLAGEKRIGIVSAKNSIGDLAVLRCWPAPSRPDAIVHCLRLPSSAIYNMFTHSF